MTSCTCPEVPSAAAVARDAALGTGAQRGNRTAHRHGRYSAQSREIRALGRLLNRVPELATAQLTVMNARAHSDAHRVEIVEQRVSRCMQRLAQAAVALDRVLLERGNEEGRRRLVEGALRLTDTL